MRKISGSLLYSFCVLKKENVNWKISVTCEPPHQFLVYYFYSGVSISWCINFKQSFVPSMLTQCQIFFFNRRQKDCRHVESGRNRFPTKVFLFAMRIIFRSFTVIGFWICTNTLKGTIINSFYENLYLAIKIPDGKEASNAHFQEECYLQSWTIYI